MFTPHPQYKKKCANNFYGWNPLSIKIKFDEFELWTWEKPNFKTPYISNELPGPGQRKTLTGSWKLLDLRLSCRRSLTARVTVWTNAVEPALLKQVSASLSSQYTTLHCYLENATLSCNCLPPSPNNNDHLRICMRTGSSLLRPSRGIVSVRFDRSHPPSYRLYHELSDLLSSHVILGKATH